MTKQELQKELLEKIKPGAKPSQLKKLKRSKSAGDIPSALPLPQTTALTRSKSQEPFNDPKYPFTTLISQQEELEALRKESKAKSDTIDLLRKKIEEMEKTTPLLDLSQELKRNKEQNQLILTQFQTKQKEVESLRKQLETKNQELTSLKSQHSNLLDDNLALKHQNLKE